MNLELEPEEEAHLGVVELVERDEGNFRPGLVGEGVVLKVLGGGHERRDIQAVENPRVGGVDGGKGPGGGGSGSRGLNNSKVRHVLETEDEGGEGGPGAGDEVEDGGLEDGEGHDGGGAVEGD